MFPCVHLLACTFQCVLFFMYKKLFLEWPSKRHCMQLCCLCAPACVIQFEWRKPRDTSVAFFRLRSATVCRWFFDEANLEALCLKGCCPARENRQWNKHMNTHALSCVYMYICHSHVSTVILTCKMSLLMPWQSLCSPIHFSLFSAANGNLDDNVIVNTNTF